MKPSRKKQDYNLLIDLLDHGWEIARFNAREVTLTPVPR